MERADLIRSERTDDRVQHTPVVEENKVFLAPAYFVQQLYAFGGAFVNLPVVRVDQLYYESCRCEVV